MKKLVLSFVILVSSVAGFSQTDKKDIKRKIKYGFNIGMNYSNLQSKETLPAGSDTYNGYGFIVGVIMDYELNEKLLISPKTELSFNKSGVDLTNSDNSTSSYKIFSTSLDIMTHLVYKTGNGKTLPYLMAGPKLSIPSR